LNTRPVILNGPFAAWYSNGQYLLTCHLVLAIGLPVQKRYYSRPVDHFWFLNGQEFKCLVPAKFHFQTIQAVGYPLFLLSLFYNRILLTQPLEDIIGFKNVLLPTRIKL
jgi:hypothetical protein